MRRMRIEDEGRKEWDHHHNRLPGMELAHRKYNSIDLKSGDQNKTPLVRRKLEHYFFTCARQWSDGNIAEKSPTFMASLKSANGR